MQFIKIIWAVVSGACEGFARGLRREWRFGFDTYPPACIMPPKDWALTRHRISGVRLQQAIKEESAWAERGWNRWLSGEKV